MANLGTGPFVAACVLLIVSGIAKLRDPRATLTAAHAIGLPAGPVAVRSLGVVEAGAAVVALATGRVAALLVAVLYLLLAAVALALRMRAPATPCGCLGASQTPASGAHVALNLVAAAVALTAATGGSPLTRLADQPAAGLVLVVLALCGARLAVLTLDVQETSV